MDVIALVLVLVALVIGLALGWWFGGRGTAEAVAQRDVREADFKQAIVDLALASERAREVPALTQALDELREEREGILLENARLKTKESAFEERLGEFVAAREAMAGQFREVAQQMLDGAQKNFLARADERFAQAGDSNEAKLKALLQPVETTLKRYEENLGRIEKEREGSYRELSQAVTQLTHGNAGVVRETQRLANVMRSSPKARGRWGEQQLRTVLESAGLSENVDFSLQTTVNDGERQLRPDCVIHLPGGRCIVVDVKCPLVAFEQAFDEEDESKRLEHLLAHANALKSYANDLGRKGYWRQFEQSPDFVIMFVPGEHFLSAAAERAPDLIETAFRNGVIVASTINMLALAKVMAGMWRQEKLAEEAEKIGALGKELYTRLSKMGEHVEKLGRNLNLATGAYNSFVGSLESQVMTTAKRFESHGITGPRAIEPLPTVEAGVRPLTKLTAAAGVSEPAE